MLVKGIYSAARLASCESQLKIILINLYWRGAFSCDCPSSEMTILGTSPLTDIIETQDFKKRNTQGLLAHMLTPVFENFITFKKLKQRKAQVCLILNQNSGCDGFSGI